MKQPDSLTGYRPRRPAILRSLLIALVAVLLVPGTNAAPVVYPKDITLQMPAISVTPDIATDQDSLVATFNYGCSATLVVYGKLVRRTGDTVDVLANIACDGVGREANPDDHIDLGRFTAGAYRVRLLAQTKAGPYGAEVEIVELATNTFVVSGTPPPGTVNMSEFFNPDLNHYFVTADSAETLLLRTLRSLGWQATGEQFAVLPVATALNGSLRQVCRFYGSVTPGPNSHFFTADPAECAALTQLQQTTPVSSPRWNLEGRVLVVAVPGQGNCPAAYPQPIRRFYNGRAMQNDANHRYVTSSAIALAMRTAGWVDEGVVMCAVQ